MKRFLIHLAQDVFFWWPLFVIGAFGSSPWKGYADNLLDFLAWLFGVLAVLILASASTDDFAEKTKLTLRPMWHNIYAYTTASIEVLFCAAMGWYGVAVSLTLFALASSYCYDQIKKHKEKQD